MRRLAKHGPVLASLAVFVTLVTVASLRYDHFLTYGVFLNLVRDNAFLGIVAIGMTFVILSGGIDLSVGSMVGLSSILAAKLMEVERWPALAAIPFVLVLGTAFGAGMGLVISKFAVPAFLVTLAGLFLARGAAFLVSIESISITDPLYVSLGGWPNSLPVMFAGVLIVASFMLTQRPFGRSVYAVGGGEGSAHLMGVNVGQVKASVYAISGFCSALGGVAHGIYTTSGNATAGTLLELDAIASVVIGGTLLTGGVGGLSGTVIGVLMLGLIQTVITFEGTLSSWWAKVAIGLLLLLFVLPQRLIGLRFRVRAGAPRRTPMPG